MERPIRVLLVDDDSDFSEMAADQLERRGDHFDVSTASSANLALGRLKERGFDCIVSDYQMPEMDGLEFLNKLRVMKPDLPFVMFTGKGSEEVAGTAISAGVTDYIQKSGSGATFDLLANRIENAVDRYRKGENLEAMRTRFRVIVEESTDAIFVVDREGTVKWANPVTEDLFGIPPEELTGTSAFRYVHPDDVEQLQSTFTELVTTSATHQRAQYRLKHAEGHVVPVEARARDLLNHPVIGGVVAYVRATEGTTRVNPNG